MLPKIFFCNANKLFHGHYVANALHFLLFLKFVQQYGRFCVSFKKEKVVRSSSKLKMSARFSIKKNVIQ